MMNSAEQVVAGRHVYLLKGWQRALYFLLGLIFAGMGAGLSFVGSSTRGSANASGLMAVFFVFVGGYIAAVALRSRLTIEGTRIAVRGVLQEKTADLSEIEGFRTVSSRNGTFRVLQLKEGRGTITVSSRFNTDDSYRAYFRQIEDLDETHRKTILAEIEQQQDLGATPEERVTALQTAKTWSVFALIVTATAAAALNFGGPVLQQPSAAALGLAPLAAVFLVLRSPLLYAVFKRKKDPRAELCFILIVAGFGLLIRMREISFVSMQPLLLLMAAAAGAVILGFYSSVQSASNRGALMGLLILAGLYGYGLVTVVDTFFDGTAGERYSAAVVGKHTASGRSTTYYLRLAPWGPVERDKDESVSSKLYDTVTPGEPVCLELHPGTLHAAWYRVSLCSDAASF